MTFNKQVDQCTVKFSNVPFELTREVVDNFFSQFGSIKELKLPIRGNGKLKGYGSVIYNNTKDAQKAVDAHGSEFSGRAIRIERIVDDSQIEDIKVETQKPDDQNDSKTESKQESRSQIPTKPKQAIKSSPRPTSCLFVGNLAYQTTGDDLMQFFEKFSCIRGRIVTEEGTERKRGFGYVDFGSVQGAEMALREMNGQELHSRIIRLDFTQPRQKKTDQEQSSVLSQKKQYNTPRNADSGKQKVYQQENYKQQQNGHKTFERREEQDRRKQPKLDNAKRIDDEDDAE
ncbi:MAG: putative nuclear localization sequence binding protein [Streblomastix strix]|uniref:Putative nuclear localization sequence binding protein n=1 Tax=Streblomastix strix TaxID=222440 RepID=A0A5J4WUA2_9EUKA|nr:MAG: putative nuclear localization sequence binding protein [Streblomastix strix]